MKKFSEGAEAQIYSTSLFGFDCILKRRMEKKYRLKEIDNELRLQRTKNEARILSIVSSLDVNSPKVLLIDKYDIFMSKIQGVRLMELINSNETEKIFSTLGSHLAILHQNNIIHGDYTPANVMIDKNMNVYLIDFGLAEITNSIEEKALDLLLMIRAINTEISDIFIRSYVSKSKEGATIVNRLKQIEKRGRYNTRSLLTSIPVRKMRARNKNIREAISKLPASIVTRSIRKGRDSW